MMAEIPVHAKIQEYAATSMNLQTREEIFSAMVVYGFLTYENGTIMIPNKELMDKFADMLMKEASLGYVYRLAKESDKMLKATLAGDVKTMSQILEFAHDTEVPLLSYNSEAELTALVNLVFLSLLLGLVTTKRRKNMPARWRYCNPISKYPLHISPIYYILPIESYPRRMQANAGNR